MIIIYYEDYLLCIAVHRECDVSCVILAAREKQNFLRDYGLNGAHK